MWFRFSCLLSVLLVVFAFPNGPPKSVCGNGMPIHVKNGKRIPPQNTSSPFVIEVNSTSIRPGETVRVKIRSYKGDMFRGIFLQVYPIPNGKGDSVKYSPVGLFDRKITNVKLMTCAVMLDSISHEDSFMKIETAFDWRAPLYLKHDMIIRATILTDFETYWHNVMSPRIKVVQNDTLPVEKLEKPWLEEIIKTVKNEDSAEVRRELVRARFERGFRNAVDPNGFIMINYITNMLPFEDSPVPIQTSSNRSVNEENKSFEQMKSVNMSNSEELTNQTILDDKSDVQTQTINQTLTKTSDLQNEKTLENRKILDKSIEEEFSLEEDLADQNPAADSEPLDLTHTQNKTMMEKYYQVLVRSLLKGDKLVADTLSDLIEKN